MSTRDLNKELGTEALRRLDEKLADANFDPIRVVIGGGGSMMMNHGYDGMTKDIDAIPLNINFEDIKEMIADVASEMRIDPDWFNPHFNAFTVYLSSSAPERYEEVFSGRVLKVFSLGAEDILIMKFMAGRSKDMSHIKHLLRFKKLSLGLIEERLLELEGKFPKIAKKALDLFYELTKDME